MTAGVPDRFSQPVAIALGLVAAPASNAATRQPLDGIFGQAGGDPAARLFHAALVTPVARPPERPQQRTGTLVVMLRAERPRSPLQEPGRIRPYLAVI